MRRLPNVDSLVAQIKEKATKDYEDSLTKVAEENFHTPVAAAMQKLARTLRKIDPNVVTYADIEKFSAQLRIPHV